MVHSSSKCNLDKSSSSSSNCNVDESSNNENESKSYWKSGRCSSNESSPEKSYSGPTHINNESPVDGSNNEPIRSANGCNLDEFSSLSSDDNNSKLTGRPDGCSSDQSSDEDDIEPIGEPIKNKSNASSNCNSNFLQYSDRHNLDKSCSSPDGDDLKQIHRSSQIDSDEPSSSSSSSSSSDDDSDLQVTRVSQDNNLKASAIDRIWNLLLNFDNFTCSGSSSDDEISDDDMTMWPPSNFYNHVSKEASSNKNLRLTFNFNKPKASSSRTYNFEPPRKFNRPNSNLSLDNCNLEPLCSSGRNNSNTSSDCNLELCPNSGTGRHDSNASSACKFQLRRNIDRKKSPSIDRNFELPPNSGRHHSNVSSNNYNLEPPRNSDSHLSNALASRDDFTVTPKNLVASSSDDMEPPNSPRSVNLLRVLPPMPEDVTVSSSDDADDENGYPDSGIDGYDTILTPEEWIDHYRSLCWYRTRNIFSYYSDGMSGSSNTSSAEDE